MWSDEIPGEQWTRFFREFAAQHIVVLICVVLFNPHEASGAHDPRRSGYAWQIPLVPADSDHRVAGHELTLRGMTVETGTDGRVGLTIDADTAAGIPALYIVPEVSDVWAEQPDGHTGCTLRVDSAQGQSMLIRCASPLVPAEPPARPQVGAAPYG